VTPQWGALNHRGIKTVRGGESAIASDHALARSPQAVLIDRLAGLDRLGAPSSRLGASAKTELDCCKPRDRPEIQSATITAAASGSLSASGEPEFGLHPPVAS
jgi:hypothetical protein